MSDRERFYLHAAEEMARTAAQAMRSCNEFLRLSDEARLTSERENWIPESPPQKLAPGTNQDDPTVLSSPGSSRAVGSHLRRVV